MKDLSSLAARIFLSRIFPESGFGKIAAFESVRPQMAAQGMPYTIVLLCCAIAIEIVGGLSLLLGYRTKFGVPVLLIFLAVAMFIFRTHFADHMKKILFLKNLAIVDGLLMVFNYGTGSVIVDR
jgi:putative oxidoreductase